MSKHVIKIAASAVLIFGLGLCGARANAQAGPPDTAHSGRGHRMSPDQQLDHLSKALNLTDDQKNQIRPILQDRSEKMQSIRSDSALSREDRRTRMREAFEDSGNKIRSVLNDDQKQKFDQMQQRRHDRMQKRGGPESKPDTQ